MCTTYPSVQEAKRIIMNLHMEADLDCLVGLFCFLLAYTLSPFDPRISYKFLQAGERYKGEVLPGDLVVHIDTGRIFNPATFDFDHHMLDLRSTVSYLPSAARGIYDHFILNLQKFTWLAGLIQMTDEKDSGNKNRVRLTQEVLDTKERMTQELRDLNSFYRSDLRVVCARDNLELINTLFVDAPIELVPDRERILAGLVNLLSWHSRKVSRLSGEMNDFINRGRWVTSRNRLHFILLDERVLQRKKLRNAFRTQRHYRENVDVYVFPDMTEGRSGDIGITCVIEERIDGMEELAERLRAISADTTESDRGVYLHEGRFTLYIKAFTGISQDVAETVALECLAPRRAEMLEATA
jgi:hypothetical protein